MRESHAIRMDTSREAWRIQCSRWAVATPAAKFAMVDRLCRDARTLARAGARRRFANDSPRRQQLRVGALTIDRALMKQAFGWDPEREGR